MSLKLNERYPGRYNNPSADYPQGSFKNRTSPTAKDGSYLEQDWANDKEGFFQSLLDQAEIEASGDIDKVGDSQAFDALLHLKQNQAGVAFTTSGVAPAFTLTPVPAIAAYAANQRFRVTFSAAASVSGTLNVSGLGPKNLKQYDSSGNKIAATVVSGQLADVEYDGTDMVILDPLPVSSNLIGSATNVKMAINVASASATLTADEIIVGAALGGQTHRLSGFNKVVNLATTGVGGMDTGTAPVSGWVAIYAIYNPATGVSGLLAKNATAAVQPEIYGGANMPAGFTASALVSVWATDASGKLVVSSQSGRKISTGNNSVLNSSVPQAGFTSLSIATAVPPNARSANGYVRVSSGSIASCVSQVSADTVGLGSSRIEGGASVISGNFEVPIATIQTIWYTATVSAGTITISIVLTSYTF